MRARQRGETFLIPQIREELLKNASKRIFKGFTASVLTPLSSNQRLPLSKTCSMDGLLSAGLLQSG